MERMTDKEWGVCKGGWKSLGVQLARKLLESPVAVLAVNTTSIPLTVTAVEVWEGAVPEDDVIDVHGPSPSDRRRVTIRNPLWFKAGADCAGQGKRVLVSEPDKTDSTNDD